MQKPATHPATHPATSAATSAADDGRDFARLRARILDVPDFPQTGVLFRDITPLLADAAAFRLAVESLAALAPPGADAVAAPEARGFIFGAAVAARLGAGFALVRKRGKLPRQALTAEYDLEYGRDALFMHADALRPGARVFLVDDLLATGGTMAATAQLITAAGARPTAAACLIELTALNGRQKLAALPFAALLRY